MTKEEIKNIIADAFEKIVDELTEELDTNKSLKDYGANSIDRADIAIDAMEAVGCKIPLVDLGKVSNISGLIDLLYERQNDK
jgi:polyketide biosynthesis acyl carrier protein